MTGDRPPRPHRVPAPALVLVSITSVQIGSSLARTLFDDLGAAGVTLLRLGISSLLLLLVLRPPVRRWSRGSWEAVVLLGLAMAGMNLLFYLALRTVPLGVAVTVEFVGPLLLAVVQARRPIDLLWALLAAGGVVLLGAETTSGVPLGGLALALLAGLFWAAYILASARVGQVLPGVAGLPLSLAVAAVIVLPFGASRASVAFGRPSLLLAATGVALLSSVLSYSLELVALRRMPTRAFGVLMSLEPAAAALAGLVVLGQSLGARGIVALVLVSFASAGVTLGRPAGAAPPQPLS